jgi:hypothetical protein
MLSASNMPVPCLDDDPPETTTTVLLLPAFTYIDNVTPSNTPDLITHFINPAPTNTMPLVHTPSAPPQLPQNIKLKSRPCPHDYLILLCSQKTRDARCGQSAPLLRKEFERHLRPLGLYRDMHDERPGGVGIYFISHVGGHKFSANVMVYRREGAGQKTELEKRASVVNQERPKVEESNGHVEVPNGNVEGEENATTNDNAKAVEQGGNEQEELPREAAQCIWLARIRPEDCENVIRYTVLQGKVVKPERQLRGGFDREKQLVSW